MVGELEEPKHVSLGCGKTEGWKIILKCTKGFNCHEVTIRLCTNYKNIFSVA
jgi:hypothetical protein